jgi:O-antigen/teichoic acid export membrane protein
MTTTPPKGSLGSRLPPWLVGSGVIAVAMAVMNVSTYAFTILAARLLGPRHYGALAALMGLLLVLTVVSLGLQATAARRVSADPDQTAAIERSTLAASYRSGLALGLLCLIASPLVNLALHLDSWLTAALLAVTVVPLTVMGGQSGVLQGERRWLPLALIYLMNGIGRIGCGAAGLVWRPDPLGAMAGVAVGAFFPAVVGWFALRHPSRTAGREVPPGPGWTPPSAAGFLHEMVHNSHALLAFFALSNADVVLARTFLGDRQAGLYAGGLILAKAVLFLPQFVVVVAFPSMAESGARKGLHLKSLGVVLAIGAAAVVGAAVLSGLAVVFIGGSEYAALQSQLWAFAGLGTLLAMIQLMVYNVVARQDQRSVYLIWGALVVLLCVVPFVGSVTALVTVVACVDGVLFVVLLRRSVRRGR